MITRKFVYGGVIAMVVAGSAIGVNAQSNVPATHPSGLTATLEQLAQHFESFFSLNLQLAQATATPQPTAKPAVQPTTAPTPQPTAVPQAPYIGVRVEDTANGVTVRDVIDGSPAAMAGLKADDIIQKANGTTVKNVIEFAQLILKMKPDESFKLDVMRANKATALTIKVGTEDKSKAFLMPSTMPYDGLTYDAANKSWNIFQLSDRSLLYSAGLRTSDQITGFDGKSIAPADFQAYRDGLKSDVNIKLTVKNAGKETSFTVPAAALKTFDAFSYDTNGILIDVLPAGNAVAPNLESLSHVTPVNAIAYNGKGWQVYALVDGNPLQTAGLQMNDQITAFDGKAYDPGTMRTWLSKLADTTTLKLTVVRAGKSQEINVKAGDLTTLYLIGDKTSGLFFGLPESGFPASLGIDAIALNDTVAKEHQLKLTTGALVVTLQPKSAAAAAGLEMNDVITALGSAKIDAQHDLKSLFSTLKPGEQITLDIARGDKTMQLKATLPEPDVTGEIPFLIKPL